MLHITYITCNFKIVDNFIHLTMCYLWHWDFFFIYIFQPYKSQVYVPVCCSWRVTMSWFFSISELMGNDSAHLDIAGSCIHGEVCEDISWPYVNSQQSEADELIPHTIVHHCVYPFFIIVTTSLSFINWRSYLPSRMGWRFLDTWKTGGPMKIKPSWLGESWNRNTFLSDSVCPSNLRSESKKKNRQSRKCRNGILRNGVPINYVCRWVENFQNFEAAGASKLLQFLQDHLVFVVVAGIHLAGGIRKGNKDNSQLYQTKTVEAV